ncbi:MAG TPA: BON domain-containing protein [Kofleriaceae bacterium]|nr:BON domain-containing protein [Kofleriaceae bacterium]
MATHHQNGGRNAAPPEDNRPSWRPQDAAGSPGYRSRGNEDDHEYRSWRERNYREDDRPAIERDPRRWEGSRGSEVGSYDERDPGWRSTERYGQGQSGYSAGRYGDDRSQRIQGRNEMVPSPGSFEDRGHDLGLDDRFTGRGRPGYWQDRTGYGPERYGAPGGYGGGRGFEAERFGPQRSGYAGPGYPGNNGSYGAMARGPHDDNQRYPEVHTHRGTGPHRGKGPIGYQRSDERLRELICESLTDDDQIDASQIEVTVKNGDVTLSGTVEDRRAKREAEDCTCSVAGVRDVQNLLRVRDDRQQARGGSAGQPATLSGRSEAELLADKKHRA